MRTFLMWTRFAQRSLTVVAIQKAGGKGRVVTTKYAAEDGLTRVCSCLTASTTFNPKLYTDYHTNCILQCVCGSTLGHLVHVSENAQQFPVSKQPLRSRPVVPSPVNETGLHASARGTHNSLSALRLASPYPSGPPPQERERKREREGERERE